MVTHSIRRNLLVLLLVPLLTLLGVVGANAYYTGLSISNTVYDRALYDSVLTLGILVKSGEGKVTVDLPPIARRMLEVDPMDNIYYAVRSTQGTIILGDPSLTMGKVLAASVESPVFFDSVHNGEPIRVAAAEIFPQGDNAHPVVVEVAETLKKRQTMAREILQQSVAPQLFFLVSAIIVVWFAVRHALRPFFEPLPQGQVPLEIRPVTTAFNNLMQRFEASFTSQQRFVSNAAHQLRTPVAGMRAIIEAELLGSAPGQASPTLERLHKSALRMSRLVTQLLSLSRAEPGNPAQFIVLDVDYLLQEVVEEYEVLAQEKNITLATDISSDVPVSGVPWMLSEMVGNLIDNAIRYSPAGSTVSISLNRRGAFAVLEIADAGAGISHSEIDRIFERFYRGEHVTQEGSGLGLAIVKEIADAHGARISVGPRGQGQGTLVLAEMRLA